jgi:hypothetical protein
MQRRLGAALVSWAGQARGSCLAHNAGNHIYQKSLVRSSSPQISSISNAFKFLGIRSFAVSPDHREQQDNKSFNEGHQSRGNERAEIEAFLASVPPQGVAVNVFPGMSLEVAEKKLRRKINQEGILLKYREQKVRMFTDFSALSLSRT